jgi:hypothetical protein
MAKHRLKLGPKRNRSIINYISNAVESKCRHINASCKNLVKWHYKPKRWHKRDDIEGGVEAASIQEVWIFDASVYTLLKFDIEALGIASWHAGVDIEHTLELTLSNGPVYDALGGVNHGSEVTSFFYGVKYDAWGASPYIW